MRYLAGPVKKGETRLRFGYLQRLPDDYRGERHVVVAKELPSRNGREWVEFQEVPGPAPKADPAAEPGPIRYIDVTLIKPRMSAGEFALDTAAVPDFDPYKKEEDQLHANIDNLNDDPNGNLASRSTDPLRPESAQE
jgi:hypothetical protein